MKKNKFYQIFESLDSDGDGQISAKNIDIQAVPHETL